MNIGNKEIVNDDYIKEYINNFKINHKRIYKNLFSKEILDYLENRYNDSESVSESLYRILYNVNQRPVCKHCGNKVKFNNLNKGFNQHCSNSCAQSDPKVYEKVVRIKKEKYGTANNYNKIRTTKLEKYNNEYFVNSEKTQETKLKKYGNKTYNNLDKSKETCFKKYGTEYYLNSNDCKNKTIIKLGVDNYRKTDKSKENVSQFIKNHYNEIENKKKEIFLKKYGVDNPMKSDFIKSKFNWKQQKEKEYITKKKNNTFNTSKPENESYQLLKEKYPDVIYQYRSKKYPFNCDFYIPSLDLYIECNYHWTHGDHLYNEESKEDNIILEVWKSKNNKFYNNAINTWTIRDTEKYNIAKKNNLNYLLFYNINEFKKWIYEI